MYKSEATNWWYRVRRRMVRRVLCAYKKERGAPLKILDVGCGTGLLLAEMQRYGAVEGVDASPLAVAYCKERGLSNVSVAPAASLPFPDRSFDVVTMLDVLEHLEDDRAGAAEAARVLAPGGIAIITVPAFTFLWGVTDVVSHHYRRYTRPEVRKLVEKAGLRIRYATYFNTLLFPAIALVRLVAKFLRLKPKSEMNMGGSLGNGVFHAVFSLESLFIPSLSFPFGVSILLIAHKEPYVV